MVSRQARRQLKYLFVFAFVASGIVLLLQSHWKKQARYSREDEGDDLGNMLKAAKKMAQQRQKSNVKRNIEEDPIVRISSSDLSADIADGDVLEAESILKKTDQYHQKKKVDAINKPYQLQEAFIQESTAMLRNISNHVVSNHGDILQLGKMLFEVKTLVNRQEEAEIEMENLLKSRLNFIAEKQQEILKQTTEITKSRDRPFYRITTFPGPPVSAITCHGNSTIDRVCRVKNLCYDPTTDMFFVFKDPNSLEVNTPRNRSYLVDMTSIDGHNRFFFDYQEVHPDQYDHRTFRVVDKLTFMISRFHVYNIMHTVHDDFIGLYLLHRMFAPNTDEDITFTFTQDNNIFFADSWMNLRYDYIFQLLTSNPLQFREFYRQDPNNRVPICFRDVIVGNSKEASWYTYGFLEPQGPIPNKTVSGLVVREVASYIIRRFHLPIWNENSIRGILGDLKTIIEKRKKAGRRDKLFKNISDHHFITIFSRKLDRLILNEDELAKRLQETYGLEVRYVRIEDMHLLDQITILKNTVVAVGMHGSALILSMFLPPGALLVEFFPYRVPAENYTPYKTLCNLPGIRLAYRAWTNKHPENNVSHPDKPAPGGGIKHLPEKEQQKILDSETVPPHLCCSDPTWLFRIYQDTRVHIDEVLDLVDDGIIDGYAQVNSDPADYVYIRPASVENVYCKVAPNEEDPNQLDLSISWTKPWNGVKPDIYGVWIHQSYKEYTSNTTDFVLRNCTRDKNYDIWVRPYTVDVASKEAIRGGYSEKFSCICNPESRAIKGKPNEDKGAEATEGIINKDK